MHKIIDIEERIPKLKKRRKKRNNTRLIVILATLGIALLMLLYYQLPISHVQNIHVTGQNIETKEYYIKHSGITSGDSFVSLDTTQAKKTLEKLDLIKEVTVKKQWMNDVEIVLVEHQKMAVLKTDDRYYSVLENGKILPKRLEEANYAYPILLNMTNDSYREDLMKQLTQLKPDLLLMISQIEAKPSKSNDNLIQIYMNDGFEVKADLTDLAMKLQYYPSIVAQLEKNKKGVINLEIGGYYNSFGLEYK